MNAVYDPVEIERQAQAHWDEQQLFRADEAGDGDKYYCLAMFPYPSGRLHMGHVLVYTLADIINRYKRLKGFNVMQPMGWDAFGLPAENAAIKNGIPPANWTRDNIANMRKQMLNLGLGIDWSREFATCDPEYYHWEQWFFVKLYEKGLVYRKNAIVNWDPVDQTVLANEQVVDGRGWRSDAVVERREMAQWFLKITDYAEELLNALDELPGWPESVKSMQRNWIGESKGVEIDFLVTGREETLTVFTTRPDTLLGATYVAVAAEHPLAQAAAGQSREVAAFVEACKQATTAEADLATMEKTGIATDFVVEHPLTGAKLPVWVANFVLMEYGSGAVMSVPGHDQRDWEFARKYDIPIVQVIEPVDDGQHCDITEAAFTEYGRLLNSPGYDGLTSSTAFEAIADALVEKTRGRRITNYRLRDWGVSRQRYWGCPIPMIHCQTCGVVPVPEQDLPVVLPTDVKFEGVRSPLTTMSSFLDVPCPKCGEPARRETDTFDTFMESSWYYARFASPDANTPMVDERVNFWAPVDYYVGGIEHAILHLLYARFYFKLMRDAGLVQGDEPFTNLLMHGMVLQDGKKMSKSAGDAGDPQKMLDRYGADTVRTMIVFQAPPDKSFEWNEGRIEGPARFLRKLWGLVSGYVDGGIVSELKVAGISEAAVELRRYTHETVQRADDDYGRRIQFNTVVSGVMALVNHIGDFEPTGENDRSVLHEALRTAILVLSPIAPHICHVLWQKLQEPRELVGHPWPEVDESALEQSTIELIVQVNGKVRGKIEVTPDADEELVKTTARAADNVVRHIDGKTIRKEIVVPNKLVNIVVG